MNDPSWRNEGRYFGKYRGLVKDNKDPSGLGRILAIVPQVPGMRLNWALPCAPYAGKGVGFYTVPPIGAKVWIEFEGGDPSHPIWSGCFWQDGEVPTEVQANSQDPSQVKVLRTRVATLVADDTPDAANVKVIFEIPADSPDQTFSDVDDDSSSSSTTQSNNESSNPITVSLTLDPSGLVIKVEGQNGTSTITMVPEKISTQSDSLATNSTKDTALTAGTTYDTSAGTDMTHKASGKINVQATGDAAISGMNVSASANTNLDLSANASATLQGNTSTTVQATGSTTVSGNASTTVSSVGSTKISGTASVSIGGATITFMPA